MAHPGPYRLLPGIPGKWLDRAVSLAAQAPLPNCRSDSVVRRRFAHGCGFETCPETLRPRESYALQQVSPLDLSLFLRFSSCPLPAKDRFRAGAVCLPGLPGSRGHRYPSHRYQPVGGDRRPMVRRVARETRFHPAKRNLFLVDVPGAAQNADGTDPAYINSNGTISGTYRAGDGNLYAFTLRNDVYTKIQYPGATATWGFGIGNDGTVVGP